MQIDKRTCRIGLCNQFGDTCWTVYLTLSIQLAGCKELFDGRMAFGQLRPLLKIAQATLQLFGPERDDDRVGILFSR